jgi:ABC-2 type transport system ATP-binding protein
MRRTLPNTRQVAVGTFVLQIRNLTKAFYSLVAVDDVSFDIPQGEVVGLLGPNGAGKTTIFRLIAGFLRPDKGSISPIGDTWPRMALKPERLLFPNRLRVQQYLRMVAGLAEVPGKPADAADEALEQVNLQLDAHKRISDCSKGMRQRLALAQTLIGDPPLLLLDEPTNGLDPEGQVAICQLIKDLHAAGKTILLSSHQLKEVTEVCTALVILNQGRVHYASSMTEALTLRPHVTIETTGPLDDLAPLLVELSPRIEVSGTSVVLREDAITLRRQVLSILLATGYDIQSLSQKRVTLEEIYAEAVK